MNCQGGFFMRYLFLILLFSFAFTSSPEEPTADATKLDKLVNDWHTAASKADFEAYFGLMNDKFVFLGTAPAERWNKIEFAAFCKPYFAKGKAWDFKTIDRNWVFSKNKKIAWFDENLSTWMRDCRGSGIMVHENGEWKLAYYNLTVLIENEKIHEFIELREK